MSAVPKAFKHRPLQTEVGDGNVFKGQEFRKRDGDRDSFNQLKVSVVDASLRFIQQSFQSLGTDLICLVAASLTSHHNWPDADRNLLPLYGEHKIRVLADHFKVPFCRETTFIFSIV